MASEMLDSSEACIFDCAQKVAHAGFRTAIATLEEHGHRRDWGKGQTVAILDSGVDACHVELCDRVVAGMDCTRKPPESQQTDGFGHGTFVAGVICASGANRQVLGLAPGARIHAVKVVSDGGQCDYRSLASGLECVVNSEASIICIPLGSLSPPPYECAELLEKVASDGRLILAATTAAPPGLRRFIRRPLMYPAACEGVLAVAESSRSLAARSPHGPRIEDACALSTLPGGSCGWRRGPSVAVAMIAGLAAALLSIPHMTVTEVRNFCWNQR